MMTTAPHSFAVPGGQQGGRLPIGVPNMGGHIDIPHVIAPAPPAEPAVPPLPARPLAPPVDPPVPPTPPVDPPVPPTPPVDPPVPSLPALPLVPPEPPDPPPASLSGGARRPPHPTPIVPTRSAAVSPAKTAVLCLIDLDSVSLKEFLILPLVSPVTKHRFVGQVTTAPSPRGVVRHPGGTRGALSLLQGGRDHPHPRRRRLPRPRRVHAPGAPRRHQDNALRVFSSANSAAPKLVSRIDHVRLFFAIA
jgi:hypothetical protein